MNSNYIVLEDQKIINAIRQIELNKKSFVFVTNKSNKLLGTVTDGDIRRALLNETSLEESITTIMSTDYEYLQTDSSIDDLISKFKNKKIGFLPILDSKGYLVNFLTKKHLHILLMSDISFDLSYNFDELDENTLEYEIYNRPWGIYKTTFFSDFSQSKIIKVFPGGALSLQEHKKREEHWVIIKGVGELTLGETVKEVHAGDHVYIPKGCKHRLQNHTKNILIVAEVQLGEYFGEDDIIRYSDIYGRT
ncbi:CBS domain-containing protein [Acidaminobacter sp. JC074]|uniref:CBS domain-containing protein n=1 Tax=Acidaminobacter sp. JC074 TaxID=2530199 RepID=UPI001F0EC1C1|nr:CBS domain-containing protein [Acidaminobacter sp. JC074]MCH4889292.1 CBS domain-containing protein [Acidaminobacter sp. JC074]